MRCKTDSLFYDIQQYKEEVVLKIWFRGYYYDIDAVNCTISINGVKWETFYGVPWVGGIGVDGDMLLINLGSVYFGLGMNNKATQLGIKCSMKDGLRRALL